MWVTLAVIMATVMVSADTREIVLASVLDSTTPRYATNLKNAVEYLNLEKTSTLKTDHVNVHIIMTSDNDTFGALEQVCTAIPEGIDVILDQSSRYVTATMRSLAEAMGVSHVAAVDPSFYEWSHGTYNISVNFEPPESIILNSIRDIVSHENLTNVGIIYDSTFDLDNKPKRLLRNIPAQHLYLRMPGSKRAIAEQLDKVKAAELQHVFLAGDANNAQLYLGQANSKGMMTFRYNWYVLTKAPKIECTGCTSRSSVTVLTGRTAPASRAAHEYVAFMNAKGWQQTGMTFSRSNIEMSAAFHFDLVNLVGEAIDGRLRAGQWNTTSDSDCNNNTLPSDRLAYKQALALKQDIQNMQYTGVFGQFSWDGDTARQNIVLDIKRLTSISETKIGNWTLQDGLNAFHGTITNKDIKKTYRVLTIMEPPFVFKSDTLPLKESPEVEHVYYNASTGAYYYGYCIDLIFNINKTMDFDFVLYEPADGAYGTMQADGSWTGMIRELIEDRADIAVAPLSVMAERENVVDFTVPYYDLVGITILMKKPKFEYSVFKFMSVLEDAVWGCVFSAFIIVSVLLAVFDKFSPYSYQNNKESWDGQGEEPRVFTLKEGLWFCMTSLTPQGGGEAPRALSGRLVAATWWMFGFIMIATYTANLAAFLTVSRLDQPIESLDDLAKQFKTKYAPQHSSATETYFRRMADIEEKFYTIWKAMSLNDSLDQVERAKLAVWDYPVSDKFTNMWVSMTESGFPKSFKEAIERIKNPKVEGEDFAFIGDATQNKYATLTDCALWEVGEEFSRKPYAIAVQEGSPLKNDLSSVILQLLNQRVLEDLKTFWWEYNREHCQKIEDESDGISIYNIGGVFLVIFIGIGLGLITLAFEYYWYRLRPKRQGPAAEHNHATNHNHAGNAAIDDINNGSAHAHSNDAFDIRT